MVEEKAILERDIDRTTALVAVSMTTIRGVSWSCVKMDFPSGEIEMRCTLLEMGIDASKVHARKSRTLTVPGSLFAECWANRSSSQFGLPGDP
jgi:hypothetical protein